MQALDTEAEQSLLLFMVPFFLPGAVCWNDQASRVMGLGSSLGAEPANTNY